MGDEVTPEVNDSVLALFRQLEAMRLPGLLDLVPAFNSLSLLLDPAHFDRIAPAADPLHTVRAWIDRALKLLESADNTAVQPVCMEIPVCYNHPDTPDLARVSELLGLSVLEIVRLHTATVYRVYMLGFLPGFPYLGILDERLHVPRLARPRMRVPAGSVAIAGKQTGIYPSESPGGWNLIGKTPVKLYDPALPQPALLRPGDLVRFTIASEV